MGWLGLLPHQAGNHWFCYQHRDDGEAMLGR